MSDTIRYHIDGSSLSVEEFKKVEDLLYKSSFFCYEDLSKPRCFFCIWQEDQPPDKVFKLPGGCLVRRM